MPIYQYDCGGCGKRVDIFFRSVSKAENPVCPECESVELSRVMSMFARARSSGQRLADIDLVAEQGRLESGDVGEFARWARKAGAEFDEELGSSYRELAEKAEAGEDPVERIDAGHSFAHRVQEQRARIASAGSEGGSESGSGGDAD